MNEILRIEELAMRAWPAEEIEALDGWWLRWHRVPSRRVNSVWPNGWGGDMPLAVKLQRVQEFYLLRGQTVCYQICPAALPSGLDDLLETQGFVKKSETAVQVASVEQVIQAPSLPLDEKKENGVEMFESLTETWLEAYCRVQEGGLAQLELRREALSRVQQRGIYALIRGENGEPAAVGRGVLDQGWMGIFGMATETNFRRRGFASAILSALSQWASTNGAQNMYLQVMESNPGAKALYEKLGFRTRYHYHYREQTPN